MKEILNVYINLVEEKLNTLNKYKEKLTVIYGFPLKKEYFLENDIEFEELMDAIVYKFNKLQSIMGEKIFKLVLEYAGMEAREKSFLEILSLLEKEKILDMRKWREVRNLRNSFSHIYPNEADEMTENANLLIENISYLQEVFQKLKQFKEKTDEAYSK